MSGDTFDLVQGGVVTESGLLYDQAATVGDVLTVQADKSIAAEPSGGSTPGAVTIRKYHIAFDDTNIQTTGKVLFAADEGDLVGMVMGIKLTADWPEAPEIKFYADNATTGEVLDFSFSGGTASTATQFADLNVIDDVGAECVAALAFVVWVDPANGPLTGGEAYIYVGVCTPDTP